MNDNPKSLTTPLPPLNPGGAVLPRQWRDYEISPFDIDRPQYPDWGDMPKDYRRILDGLRPESITSSGTSKTFTLPSPQKGERWYVKDAYTQLLVRVKVIDVTPRTVEIQIEHPQTCLGLTKVVGGRYEKGYLSFVEKVADAESVESE